MRLPTSHTRRSNGIENNTMTPMIDVVFLLLIFFICAATGQAIESTLTTELASGSVEAADPMETPAWQTEIWVKLVSQGKGLPVTILLNDGAIENFSNLRAQLLALAEVSRENPVVLDIGDDVPLSEVVRTLDLCKEGKFESVNFAVEDSKQISKKTE